MKVCSLKGKTGFPLSEPVTLLITNLHCKGIHSLRIHAGLFFKSFLWSVLSYTPRSLRGIVHLILFSLHHGYSVIRCAIWSKAYILHLITWKQSYCGFATILLTRLTHAGECEKNQENIWFSALDITIDAQCWSMASICCSGHLCHHWRFSKM